MKKTVAEIKNMSASAIREYVMANVADGVFTMLSGGGDPGNIMDNLEWFRGMVGTCEICVLDEASAFGEEWEWLVGKLDLKGEKVSAIYVAWADYVQVMAFADMDDYKI